MSNPAASELPFVELGLTRHLVGHIHQPGFLQIAPISEPGVAFVIRQILVSGIRLADSIFLGRDVRVPTDELNGIPEVGTAGATAASFLLVPVPSSVNHLGISVCGRLPAGWNDLQEVGSRCFGPLLKLAFLP